ncbi:MAG: cyclic nucleotide-binding domain-containing protein [Spirochaetaceae bacterium]|jgi:CRP-like cAMP-binding protein|nr:cyclic nucleotide-binding domain-containing protein [Spirochaetaceae bacterium]
MQAGISFPLVSFSKGSTITEQNSAPGKYFYVIQSGTVSVLDMDIEKDAPDDKTLLGIGDFFSVETVLTNSFERITAIAETDVTAIAVTKEALPAFIKENLPVSTKILHYLSKRLHYLNEKKYNDNKKTSPTHGLSHLYNFGKFYLKRNLFRTAYCAFHQYLEHCPTGKNVENARRHIEKLASYSSGLRFDYDDREITRIYPIDSVIFFEKEPSRGMFVLRSGSVKMTRIIDDKEVTLAVLKAGDIAGQMGLIDTKPRSATAIACEDCEIIAIAHTAYLPILRDGAHILSRICITLSERIAKHYESI